MERSTMETFLKIVAKDLYAKCDGDLSRTAIIFPNKRAGLFFDQWLAQCTDKPIWTPVYMTISELLRGLSASIVADPIRLVCTLYQVFCQEIKDEDQGEEETLDNFFFWGEMLIADFDDLDKNLVDADRLFSNLKDLHELIDDHSFLTDEQVDSLKMFFQNFSIEKDTELKRRFMVLWNNLGSIYHKFRETLSQEGLAYEGQLYRDAVENMDTSRLSYDRYVFVGFNVLNKVEQELFSKLKGIGKAMFYWDYDKLYTEQAGNEAGVFIKQNLVNFPNELDDESLFMNLSKPKTIEYIAASTENAQAGYVPDWLKTNLTKKENETAVVLCNESLLQSVLHTLPSEQIKALNITMGYPLSGTPIHSLITILADLYTDGYDKASGRYHHRHVLSVLRHPYVRRLTSEADALEKNMVDNNKFFPLASELQCGDTLQQLFPTDGVSNCTNYLNQLTNIITLVSSLFRHEEESQSMPDEELGKESLFKCYTLTTRLTSLVESGHLTVNLTTMNRLLKRLLSGQSIPFHGEPAIGLQVMGVLETRNLDFRHILMLSVGEGQLPKRENNSSFIPHHLRRAFGMTTVEHKTAVYAYYFYRLIQRAERVTMLYNTSSEGLNRGEMSRFMLQYLIESSMRKEENPSVSITRYSLSASQHIQRHPGIIVNGSEDIATRLRNRFNGTDGYLSPSAINVYIDCPLKFYLRYACNMYEEKEVNEDIDASVFGNIFHRSMEYLYKEIVGRKNDNIINRSDIETIIKNPILIERIVEQAFKKEFFKVPEDSKNIIYDGLGLLNKEVIKRYVKQLLRHDAAYAPFQFVGAEIKVGKLLTITPDDHTLPFSIKLGGSIDRMDFKEGKYRIIDYKTSSHIQEMKSVEQLFDTTDNERPYHIFQTFIYATIVADEKEVPIQPALFYIQKAASKDYSPLVKFGKEDIESFSPYKDEFSERLTALLKEMFSPSTTFAQTGLTRKCSYCEFAGLCGRKV